MTEINPADGPFVLREQQGNVRTLWLNRPRQFNPLSEAMLDALEVEVAAVAADDSVRCLVLAAHGKAFCAGHDLREMRAQYRQDYYLQLFNRCGRFMQSLQQLPMPVIARVQGLATAAGCQLVATCDLAVAAESARFAVSGINVGLYCSTPAVALSRNVAPKRAFDLLATGRFIDAATAQEWGLVNRTVPDAELDTVVAEYADSICGKSAAALRHGKALFYRQRQLPLPQAYDLASEVMACNMMEADAAEGIDAFIGKRAPRWQQDGPPR